MSSGQTEELGRGCWNGGSCGHGGGEQRMLEESVERERVGDSWAPTEGPLDAGMYEFTASFHIMSSGTRKFC